MTDTIGRLIKRPPGGTSGGTNVFQPLSALSSGAAAIWLTSDLNHILYESSFRALVTLPGWDDVSLVTPGDATRDPTAADIDWRSPTATAGAANACLGAHWIPKVGTAPSVFPKVVLRTKVFAAGTSSYYLGVYFAATPGRFVPPDAATRAALGTRVAGSGTWVNLAMELELVDADTAGVMVHPVVGDAGASTSPIEEPMAGQFVTLWVGAYSTGGKSTMGPITVSLEPP